MSQRIHITSAGLKRIIPTNPTVRSIEADLVATALGAEPAPLATLETAGSPVTKLTLRAELQERLSSQGGRPGLSGATRRQKIPLSETEWVKLEELAAELAEPSLRPSPGQVAGVLLSTVLRSLGRETEPQGSGGKLRK
jgi:hypothetical protein